MNVLKKVFSFLKKEAFYVVLLLCLCAVAITAAYTAKKQAASNNSSQKQVAQNEYKVNENSSTNEMPNADLVKNEAKKQESSKKAEAKTSQVSNVAAVKFVKPIANGTISREYKETPFKIETLDAFCTMKGISVKAAKGTSVLAAADGKVTDVGESDDNLIGCYVEVTHSNGMKTVYSNLDKNVKVKKNDVVKQGQQLGVTGNTAISLKKDKIAQDLGFQVLNAKNEQVNPTKYVSFK